MVAEWPPVAVPMVRAFIAVQRCWAHTIRTSSTTPKERSATAEGTVLNVLNVATPPTYRFKPKTPIPSPACAADAIDSSPDFPLQGRRWAQGSTKINAINRRFREVQQRFPPKRSSRNKHNHRAAASSFLLERFPE
jgi:hypothetical protein